MPEPNEQAPPFFIRYRVEKWPEMLGLLESKAKKTVNITSEDNNTLIRVCVESWEDYKALSPILDEYIVPTPKETRQEKKTRRKTAVKALLRGLPWLCSEEMVRSCLTQAGFGNVAVRLHNRTNKKKPPLFILAVEADGDILAVEADGDGRQVKKGSQVFELHKLLGFPVQVEPLPAGLDPAPQCYKCQEEGHVAKHCRNRAKCVKCAGEHVSHTCPLARETQPTCARCRGPHVASWRGCPAFRDRSNVSVKSQQSSRPKTKKRRRRRRRRSVRFAPAPTEQQPAPLPAARPATAATGDRGGGGSRTRGGIDWQSTPTYREARAATAADIGDGAEAVTAHARRPAGSIASESGAGEGRLRAAGRRHPAPTRQEEEAAAVAEGGAAFYERGGTTAEIEAALKEAESRFRVVLHAEMEAAFLSLNNMRRTQTEATRLREEQGTQTEGHRPEQKQKEKKLVINRAVQTDTEIQDTGTVKTREERNAESQTIEIINGAGSLLNLDVMKIQEKRYGKPEQGDRNYRYQVNWLEFRHTEEYKQEKEEEKKRIEEERLREENRRRNYTSRRSYK